MTLNTFVGPCGEDGLALRGGRCSGGAGKVGGFIVGVVWTDSCAFTMRFMGRLRAGFGQVGMKGGQVGRLRAGARAGFGQASGRGAGRLRAGFGQASGRLRAGFGKTLGRVQREELRCSHWRYISR